MSELLRNFIYMQNRVVAYAFKVYVILICIHDHLRIKALILNAPRAEISTIPAVIIYTLKIVSSPDSKPLAVRHVRKGGLAPLRPLLLLLLIAYSYLEGAVLVV